MSEKADCLHVELISLNFVLLVISTYDRYLRVTGRRSSSTPVDYRTIRLHKCYARELPIRF